MTLERTPMAKIMGIPMKHVSLLALTFQNSALILFMHHSRIMPLINGQRYLPSTAVLIAEVMKLTLSLTVALYQISNKQPNLPVTTLFGHLASAIFFGDSWKLAIPATLFTLQSSLHFIAVSHLGAATFQVTNELKILTTALFSVLLLGRNIPAKQWSALILLTVGVGVVLLPVGDMAMDFKALRDHSHPSWWMPRSLDEWKEIGKKAGSQVAKRSATYQGLEEDYLLQHPRLNSTVGFVSAIIACISSGLASVAFEKVLKDHRTQPSSGANFESTVSLWIRNVQLSIYSIIPAFLIGVVYKDGERIAQHGFLAGYNWVVWMTVILQAAGGIIVALVISYANSIAKNFATSVSIIVSSVASILFFDMTVTLHYVFGTSIVVAATWLYNDQGASRNARQNPSIKVEPTHVKPLTPRLESSTYFDLESVGSPFSAGANALSTSRPGTPSHDRHHFRVASGRRQFEKRIE